MRVRALRRMMRDMRYRRFRNFDFKLHWQILGWIAGSVIASLVPERPSHRIFPRRYRMQRADQHANGKVASVHVQLLVGSEFER